MNEAENDFKRDCEHYARDYHCTPQEAENTAICQEYKDYLRECDCAGVFEKEGNQ